MPPLERLRSLISETGETLERARMASRVRISSETDLESHALRLAGIYWIETNMSIGQIQDATEVCGKRRRQRIKKPDGVGFIDPDSTGFQIIYSGTRENIQSRLFEHLFNRGNAGTGKLGCDLRKREFHGYEWYIYQLSISDYPSRYALEAWWRLNK